ncbi:PaaI family thioesterase [Mycobacterium sp. 236(2023)]|uniref:PaaI family thioesterase n=1 Tax=Mycobacterium sp. 236(2023) TaxID=3038163 RepID=UPI002414EE8B|nr:PaaI family thioesterase [Mycobacterium sp. 236(2023)]MDG4669224.1 PaaI family thioesterase [Mycobacterium sp. 236(2023)]
MPVTIPGHLFGKLPFYDVFEGEDTVIVDLHNRADLVNIRGALQGGLVATLIDVAAGRLAQARADGGVGVGTADMTIHYLAPIIDGPARAVAKLVRAGRRIIVVGVDVFDVGRGRLAARATLSFATLEARKDQAVAAP